MTKVLADPELRAKLKDLAEPLEICDESGRVLARLLPATNEYEGLAPQISEEEIQRRRQNKGKTYSTQDVLARLGNS